MDRVEFQRHLMSATQHAFDCAREFVRNPLPTSFRYLVHLNESYDGNPLEAGETTFPEDDGRVVGPLADHEVVDLLWRAGRIPEWIDISVARTDGVHTFMQLLCCGRFTDQAKHLYYRDSDVCPFGVKSPYLPQGWEVGDDPFDLHWRVQKA